MPITRSRGKAGVGRSSAREQRAALAQEIALGEMTLHENAGRLALLKGAEARCLVCEKPLSAEMGS